MSLDFPIHFFSWSLNNKFTSIFKNPKKKYLPFVSLASEMTDETKSKANKRQPFILKIGAELIKIEILTILT